MKDVRPIFEFLKALIDNNNRDWMLAHKKQYDQVKKEFEALVSTLLTNIAAFDSRMQGVTAKQCVFRINRDIRFSKDKSPYKNNFGAAMTPGGKKADYATYYLHLQPGASFVAGGIYMPQPAVLHKVRQEVDYNAGEFQKILNEANYKALYGELQGEKLKRPPKGYEVDNPNIEWLKHKSFIAMHHLNDDELFDDHLVEKLTQMFAALLPFNSFLNRALD
jgi:uncharacterized protein (TIGR02453 family)